MEMNEWWKDASRDAVAVGQDVETVTNHPPIRKTIVLPDFANDRERQQFDEAISFGPSAMVDICSEETPINRRMPLILHALVQPDRQFLEYLLSVESFEVNPLMERNLDGNDILEKEHTFFHELSQIVFHKSLPGEIDLDQIDFILDQKAINLEVLSACRLSPLEVLCAASNRKARELDLAKIFLSHGAEITDFALNFTAQNERNLFHLFHLYNAARRSIRTMGDFRDVD